MNKLKNFSNRILIFYSESLIFFLVFYSMMIPQRFKQIAGINIDGIIRTHELYLYSILIIVKLIIDINFKSISINKVFLSLTIVSISYMLMITLITGINNQSIYALLSMIIPTLMLLIMDFKSIKSKQMFFYFIGFVTIFYSAFILLLVTQYQLFESLIPYSRRPHLMIGSSVAVSYVLVLFLPVNLYKLYTSNCKFTKIYFLISSVISIGAIAILVSRGAFLTQIVILLLSLILYKGNVKTYLFIIFLICLGLFSMYYLHINYDLSRIFNAIDLNGTDLIRRDAFLLGYEIFKDHIVFGTGLGQYFVRVWESPSLVYNEFSGLVDPHNVYIMMLSELGILGTISYASVHGYLIFSGLKMKDYNKKILFILVYIALALMHIGGSHLMNEFSVAVVMISILLLVKNNEVNNGVS